jgi:hypothetical protein
MSSQIKERRLGTKRRETKVQTRKLQGYMAKIAVTKKDNETAKIFKRAFVKLKNLKFRIIGKEQPNST